MYHLLNIFVKFQKLTLQVAECTGFVAYCMSPGFSETVHVSIW